MAVASIPHIGLEAETAEIETGIEIDDVIGRT